MAKSAASFQPPHSADYRDVAEQVLVWRWLTSLARQDARLFMALAGDNRKAFRNLFGPPSGYSPGQVWDWSLTGEGLRWWVKSGPGGTIYLLQNPPPGSEGITGATAITWLRSLLPGLAGTEYSSGQHST